MDVLFSVLAIPVLAIAAYLFFLAILSATPTAPASPPPRLKFDVVVPAHNEEAGIVQTVESLSALAYPAHLRRIIVVADNCQDQTAALAQKAGATVWARNDLERRGKGYALQMAFERSLADGLADAVVVVDADTHATANLLSAFAARLENGAQAAQAGNAVLNRNASWRTRLLTIAFALFNGVRSNARERLRLSCGLRGNGMCLSREVMRRIPHHAFSIVEDLEYGIRLGEAGIRVHYVPEAQVLSEMVSSEKASRSQRLRWEGGRLQMAKRHGIPLLVKALKQRNPMLLDLAIDLLVPPLSYAVLASGLGTLMVVVLSRAQVPLPVSRWLWPVSLALLAVYVLRGWFASGVGWIGLVDLLRAPFYVFWKLLLVVRRKPQGGEWVRTERAGEAPPQASQRK